MNFTGQTKRRNINLGTKSRKSKEELLLNAKKERERRAIERRNEDSATRIQSSIRSHLVTRKLLLDLISHSTADNATAILIAYTPRMYYMCGQHLTATLIHSIRNDRPIVNIKLAQLLQVVGYFDSSEELTELVLSKFNTKYPLTNHFYEAVVGLLLDSTKNLSEWVMNRVMQLLRVLDKESKHYITSLFAIDTSKARHPDNNLRFLSQLGSVFYPELTANVKFNKSILLENLAFIYAQSKDERREVFGHCILVYLIESSGPYKATSSLSNYFRGLYSKDFLDFLVNYSNQNQVGYISAFVKSSPDDVSKNNVLIWLISKAGLMKNINKNLMRTNEKFQDLDQKTTEEDLFLLLHLLEMYLSVSSDYELLHNIDTYPIENLQEFTSRLKGMVFDCLWRASEESHGLLGKSLTVLKKIYLRDSRLHFCSTNENKNYWCSTDTEFINVDISKYIEAYETYYRQHCNSKEDDEDEDDDETSKLVMQNSLHKGALIRRKFLEEIRSSFVNSITTRQFKKLEILTKAPFFIPFVQRVRWFNSVIELDRQRLGLDVTDPVSMLMGWGMNHNNTRQVATISRENVLEDAYNSFNPIGESFKAKLGVTFINEFGQEAGIDGGGITKEFLTSVSDEGFKNEKYRLFVENSEHELYPSSRIKSPIHLKYLWFMGKVLGKCLYEQVLIDVTFADFFMKKILKNEQNYHSSFDDLASLDQELYSNLVKLLDMRQDEIDALELHFEITDDDTKSSVELVPNGSDKRVTKANIFQYVLCVADYKLNRKLYRPTLYFQRGLSAMIPSHWIEMFNSVELQMLISGGSRDIDLEDLKASTQYGGYLENDKTVVQLWEILAEFTPQQRFKFIKFVTSVPRAPLQGFAALNPHFGIRNAGREIDRLPTASTCVNLLKLPDYKDKNLLKQKLLYAINAEARFDLS